MQIEWWHWIIFGLALLLAELAIPAFVLVWFGLSALAVGIVLAILPDVALTAQLTIWLLLSMVLIFYWFKIFKTTHHKTRVGMADHAIGEIGLLVNAVAPFQKGSVRFQKPLLGSENWSCIAEQEIAAGSRVKVVQIEGSVLKVEPV